MSKDNPEIKQIVLKKLEQSASSFVAQAVDREWAAEGLSSAMDAAEEFARTAPVLSIELSDMIGIAKLMALLAAADNGITLVHQVLERVEGGPAELIRTIMYAILAQLLGADAQEVRSVITRTSAMAGFTPNKTGIS